MVPRADIILRDVLDELGQRGTGGAGDADSVDVEGGGDNGDEDAGAAGESVIRIVKKPLTNIFEALQLERRSTAAIESFYKTGATTDVDTASFLLRSSGGAGATTRHAIRIRYAPRYQAIVVYFSAAVMLEVGGVCVHACGVGAGVGGPKCRGVVSPLPCFCVVTLLVAV